MLFNSKIFKARDMVKTSEKLEEWGVQDSHAVTSPCRGALARLAILPYLRSSERRTGLTDPKYLQRCKSFACLLNPSSKSYIHIYI